ncbi:MAG: MOSC domain-containing protein [Pseudomonadota bacterium]
MNELLNMQDLIDSRTVTRSLPELIEELPRILASPKIQGTLCGISIRPEHSKRRLCKDLHVSAALGATGDLWVDDGWMKDANGAPHPDIQLTLINSRCINFIAGGAHRWHLAGDNLAVDLDLSEENLPVGQKLQIGDAIIQITDVWHGPCNKFLDRFGRDAVRFTAGQKWRRYRLRGVHAKVTRDGDIRVGCVVKKI